MQTRDIFGAPWRVCDSCPHPTPEACCSRRHRRFCTLAETPAGAALVARQPPEDRPGPDTPPPPHGPRPSMAPLRWAPPQPRAVLRTFLNDYSGFGRFGVWLGKGLEAAGVPVAYDAVAIDEGQRKVSDWQRSRLEADPPEPWRLQLHYLGYPVAPGRATVYFSMTETTGLLPKHVAQFNRAVAMIVPTRWNADAWRRAGVTAPLHVVPAGVSAEEGFRFVEGEGATRRDGTFRILFAAMLQAGGHRKGYREALEAFVRAFPRGDEDVELVLKLWPTCVPHLGPVPCDRRIRIVTDPYTTHELADLYRTAHVLLAPTRGEGWGLHSIEAQACGCVPIIPLASGTTEFATPTTVYPVEYDWRPAEGYYAGMGDWHVPRMTSLVAQLRRAYADRDELAAKGRAAAAKATTFTWEAAGEKLAAALREIGMLQTASPRPRSAKPRLALGIDQKTIRRG